MVVVPGASAWASPVFASTVDVVVDDESQPTFEVRSDVLLSVYVPVAVNCCVSPLASRLTVGVPPPPPQAANVSVTKQIKTARFDCLIPPTALSVARTGFF